MFDNLKQLSCLCLTINIFTNLKKDEIRSNTTSGEMCFSYLGGHNPVITEFGWYESLSGRTRTMANIDSSTVYSSLITTKLEQDTEQGVGVIKIRDKRGYISNSI